MTSPDSKPQKIVICACSGTTEEQIKRQFDKGVRDLEGVSHATGACSGCGACDGEVLALIAEFATAE